MADEVCSEADPLARLVADGKVERPRDPGPLPEPLAPRPTGPTLSQVVLELRDEESTLIALRRQQGELTLPSRT
jgi:hypothetical protein